MTETMPTIQFFDGIAEELSDVSLRRNRTSGQRIVMMTFRSLKSLEQFNSFRNRFAKGLKLIDAEGELTIEPSSIKFYFGGPFGDDLDRMECKFEIDREDHWERFLRFMHRYAEANGMEYGENS